MAESTVEVVRQVKSALHNLQNPPDKPLIVALSGGVDSQVLAHALLNVARETGQSLCAVHVNHGLRDAASKDADAVASLCRDWGVQFNVVEVDVQSWSRALQQGTEAAARAARYSALAMAADEAGADTISTGHTLDDQAETVLLRLIAGSGLEGLGGMSQVSRRSVQIYPDRDVARPVTIFRPLLDCSRDVIEQYARECDLRPVEDSTNQETTIRRNAIRLQVLPELEQIEPAVRQAISRTSLLLREDAEFINDSVDQLCAEVVAERAGIWLVERQQFRDAYQAQQRRILYRVIEPLLPPNARVGQERIEALREAVVSGRPGKKIELADNLVAYVDYDRLALGRADTLESDLRKLSWVPLIEPGTELSVCGDIDITLHNGWRVRGQAPEESGLVLRNRRDGDRVRGPRGRTVKLQDWLVDRKVPRYLRDWLPVVADGDEIRWIIGLDLTEYTDARKDVLLHLELDAGIGSAG